MRSGPQNITYALEASLLFFRTISHPRTSPADVPSAKRGLYSISRSGGRMARCWGFHPIVAALYLQHWSSSTKSHPPLQRPKHWSCTTPSFPLSFTPDSNSFLLLACFILGFCKDRDDGNYRDPDNCFGFITCSNYMTYKRHCPAGLKYNQAKDWCDWPKNVLCKPDQSTYLGDS